MFSYRGKLPTSFSNPPGEFVLVMDDVHMPVQFWCHSKNELLDVRILHLFAEAPEADDRENTFEHSRRVFIKEKHGVAGNMWVGLERLTW